MCFELDSQLYPSSPYDIWRLHTYWFELVIVPVTTVVVSCCANGCLVMITIILRHASPHHWSAAEVSWQKNSCAGRRGGYVFLTRRLTSAAACSVRLQQCFFIAYLLSTATGNHASEAILMTRKRGRCPPSMVKVEEPTVLLSPQWCSQIRMNGKKVSVQGREQ